MTDKKNAEELSESELDSVAAGAKGVSEGGKTAITLPDAQEIVGKKDKNRVASTASGNPDGIVASGGSSGI